MHSDVGFAAARSALVLVGVFIIVLACIVFGVVRLVRRARRKEQH
jgi:hypothetical protein